MATLTLFRFIRRTLHRITEFVWLALFRLLGLFRRRADAWQPGSDNTVVVIAPHPDDEVLGCAGAITQHLDAGDEVIVIIITDGRLSRAGGLTSAEMARTRKAEAVTAAGLLNVTRLVMLDVPEGTWETEAVAGSLRVLLAELAPHIIYAPCWLDYHPEHQKVATALSRVVSPEADVRIYTLHVPLNDLANLIVDVSGQMDLIARLFAVYATQSSSLVRGLRLRRYLGALYECGAAAEAYWSLSGAAYRRVHDDNPTQPRVRGMRYWSFTDPLAFIVGRGDRRAMKQRSATPQ